MIWSKISLSKKIIENDSFANDSFVHLHLWIIHYRLYLTQVNHSNDLIENDSFTNDLIENDSFANDFIQLKGIIRTISS